MPSQRPDGFVERDVCQLMAYNLCHICPDVACVLASPLCAVYYTHGTSKLVFNTSFWSHTWPPDFIELWS